MGHLHNAFKKQGGQLNIVRYVLGFIFSENGHEVLLILKQKPEWQKGKFNGIGGKIEGSETPIEAMIREGEEKAGYKDIRIPWNQVGVLAGEGFRVDVLFAHTNYIYAHKQMEKEVLFVYNMIDLTYMFSHTPTMFISNVMPMILMGAYCKDVKHFDFVY